MWLEDLWIEMSCWEILRIRLSTGRVAVSKVLCIVCKNSKIKRKKSEKICWLQRFLMRLYGASSCLATNLDHTAVRARFFRTRQGTPWRSKCNLIVVLELKWRSKSNSKTKETSRTSRRSMRSKTSSRSIIKQRSNSSKVPSTWARRSDDQSKSIQRPRWVRRRCRLLISNWRAFRIH